MLTWHYITPDLCIVYRGWWWIN